MDPQDQNVPMSDQPQEGGMTPEAPAEEMPATPSVPTEGEAVSETPVEEAPATPAVPTEGEEAAPEEPAM